MEAKGYPNLFATGETQLGRALVVGEPWGRVLEVL